MEPSWYENPAQINTYADNLENFKNIGKPLSNQRKLTTGRGAQRASERSERSERSVQEVWEALRSKTEPNLSKRLLPRNITINSASRSMSSQVYLGGGFASQDASKKVKKPLVL